MLHNVRNVETPEEKLLVGAAGRLVESALYSEHMNIETSNILLGLQATMGCQIPLPCLHILLALDSHQTAAAGR